MSRGQNEIETEVVGTQFEELQYLKAMIARLTREAKFRSEFLEEEMAKQIEALIMAACSEKGLTLSNDEPNGDIHVHSVSFVVNHRYEEDWSSEDLYIMFNFESELARELLELRDGVLLSIVLDVVYEYLLQLGIKNRLLTTVLSADKKYYSIVVAIHKPEISLKHEATTYVVAAKDFIER